MPAFYRRIQPVSSFSPARAHPPSEQSCLSIAYYRLSPYLTFLTRSPKRRFGAFFALKRAWSQTLAS